MVILLKLWAVLWKKLLSEQTTEGFEWLSILSAVIQVRKGIAECGLRNVKSAIAQLQANNEGHGVVGDLARAAAGE